MLSMKTFREIHKSYFYMQIYTQDSDEFDTTTLDPPLMIDIHFTKNICH